MKNAFPLAVASSVSLFVLAAVVVGAEQQQVSNSAASKTISIGQPIDEAKRILQDGKFEFAEGGLALSGPADAANLLVVLDKNGADAAIHYSKSKKTITGVSLIYSPPRKQSKSTQTWLSAKSITLEPDGSYSVHFLPPRKEAPADAKAKNVFPGGATPANGGR